jgi:2-polyprenyl-3-methyl-5-hydroxy-6-metoxy-1,4-benzoquinol methylase
MQRTGLIRHAVYLVRPDGHIALAEAGRNAAFAVADYFRAHKIKCDGEANVKSWGDLACK